MKDEKLTPAEAAYKAVCEAVNTSNYINSKNESDLRVFLSVNGEDIPIEMFITVDEDSELVRLESVLPCRMGLERRAEGAVAACVANYNLADGNFDYDFRGGYITFRMTSTFKDRVISKYLIQYLIYFAKAAVDRYNDQFLALERGHISISQFIEKWGS